MLEPCNWPVTYSACGGVDDNGAPTCEPLASLPPETRAQLEAMAVDFLYRWTGGSLGLCPVTIRPCKTECTEGVSPYNGGGSSAGFAPALIRGQWFNVSCGQCGDNCGCGYTPSVDLPGPVAGIEQVVIDGQILDPAAYRVDNWRYLVRTDGGDWPTCQDMTRPSAPATPLVDVVVPDNGPTTGGTAITVTGSGFDETADRRDTFEITYLRGREVPYGGQIAAGLLACELAKDACGDKSCRLPRRVSSIDRQGVSVVFDDFSGLDAGTTGIYLIDSWVTSITKPRRPSFVRSPDLSRVRGTVTTWP